MKNKNGIPGWLMFLALIAAAGISYTIFIEVRKVRDVAFEKMTNHSENEVDDNEESNKDLITDEVPFQDSEKVTAAEEMKQDFTEIKYTFMTNLADVTNGKKYDGSTFEGATGVAQAVYQEEEYLLYVIFENLPDLSEEYFYEGWIVRQGDDMNVISTGEVIKRHGVYTNKYISKTDLTDHTFYVLTIEPEDNDPAPGDHILEGTLGEVTYFEELN